MLFARTSQRMFWPQVEGILLNVAIFVIFVWLTLTIRYESLITRYSPLKTKADSLCAVGINISVEKITSAIASYQSAFLKTLVKENRSFGFWSPRRCDVYVVSYHAGNLQERLEVVAYLWQHNISADLMYESALPDGEHENYADVCAREGILFTVYPRPRTGSRREQAAFKVKSILKGTEYERES